MPTIREDSEHDPWVRVKINAVFSTSDWYEYENSLVGKFGFAHIPDGSQSSTSWGIELEEQIELEYDNTSFSYRFISIDKGSVDLTIYEDPEGNWK